MGLKRILPPSSPPAPPPGSDVGGGGGGVAPRDVDLSILSTVAAPDPLTQRKYEAMGLPDPIAFALLAAIGAVPNPMALLNKMMVAAQEQIESAGGQTKSAGDSVTPGMRIAEGGLFPTLRKNTDGPLSMPPGKSFVEAFQAMHKEDEQAAQEAAEQARMAASRAKEAAALAAANRDAAMDTDALWSSSLRASNAVQATKNVASVFSSAAEVEAAEEGTKPGLETLSSLLTGRQQSAQDGVSRMAAGGQEKVCISKLPRGVTESAVRLECARHGAVTSVILEADGLTAYVTYAAAEMAAATVRRLSDRPGLFGGLATEPVQVRLTNEIPESVRLATSLSGTAPSAELIDPANLPAYLQPKEERKKKRSRSRRRSSRSRKDRKKRRQRSRSMVRWLDRSRSNSHTATGQYIRATGCSSTVRWWEKKNKAASSSSSSSSRGRGRRQQKDREEEAKKPRQVAVKGNWAQFVQNGMSYYYHVLTGRTAWDKPNDFVDEPSRRPWEVAAAHAEEAAARTGTRSTTCFL